MLLVHRAPAPRFIGSAGACSGNVPLASSRRASRNRAELDRESARVVKRGRPRRAVRGARRTIVRGRTAVSSVSRSSGRTSRMLQYGSGGARRQGFLERVADDLRAFARGRGGARGMAEAERPRGGSEPMDSLTGGGGARDARSPSPPTPLPRVPCRPTPRLSPRAGRAATPSSPAPGRARDTSTHARRTPLRRRCAPKRCGRATNSRSRLRGRGHTVNLTEDAPVRPVECDLRGLEIEHAPNRDHPARNSGAIFGPRRDADAKFAERKPDLRSNEKPSLIDHRSVEPRVDRDTR